MLLRSRVFILGAALGAMGTSACQIEIEPVNEPADQSSWPGAPHGEEPQDSWSDSEEPLPWAGAVPEEPRAPSEPPQAAPDLGAPKPAPKHPVDPFRELLIADVSIVASNEAANASPGARWSFRRMLRLLGGAGNETALAQAWLTQWETVTRVGPYDAPVTPRPNVRQLLIEPWFNAPQSAASPGAYGAGSSPAADEAVWRNAPFELLAIVNRIDLAAQACSGTAGELRFVYTARNVASRAPMNMTVIVEIPYPSTRRPRDWAAAWHRLGALPSTGEAYRTELGELTDSILGDADPLAVRLGTNEAALGLGSDPTWELREFRLKSDGAGPSLVMVPLDSTPRSDVQAGLLAAHLVTHADDVLRGPVSLPEELRGGAARVPRGNFSWETPSLSESLRLAFSRSTCNGCHGGDSATLPFQHIAPPLAGSSSQSARLSPFLYAPGSSTDELRRRALALDRLLAARCDESTPPYTQ